MFRRRKFPKRVRAVVRRMQPSIYCQSGVITTSPNTTPFQLQLLGASYSSAAPEAGSPVTWSLNSATGFPAVRTGPRFWVKGFRLEIWCDPFDVGITDVHNTFRIIVYRPFDDSGYTTSSGQFTNVTAQSGAFNSRFGKLLVDRQVTVQAPVDPISTASTYQPIQMNLPTRMRMVIRRKFRRPVPLWYDSSTLTTQSGLYTGMNFRKTYGLILCVLSDSTTIPHPDLHVQMSFWGSNDV